MHGAAVGIMGRRQEVLDNAANALKQDGIRVVGVRVSLIYCLFTAGRPSSSQAQCQTVLLSPQHSVYRPLV